MNLEHPMIQNFIHEMEEMGVSLSVDQVSQYIKYYEMLVDWNSRMNLTAITELEDVLKKHFVDSVSLVRAYPELLSSSTKRLIDVGTGAGFPGIPLKIAFPELEVTLLDSLEKRVGFLNEVIRALGLTKISAYHGRAEDYGRDVKFRDSYDLCVSRAVANLSVLAEFCLPFVKKGGTFYSYKAETAEVEAKAAANALGQLKGKVRKVSSFTLPGSEIGRTILAIEKTDGTPDRFPRKAGTPAKKPL